LTSKKRVSRDGRRIRRSLAAAGKTSLKSAALAMAAGQVIARRSALGIAALSDPARADNLELSRILPEKVGALSSAAFGVALRSREISQQIARYSGTEAVIFASAMGALARCRTPAAVAAIQTQFATAWFFRSLSHAIAVNEIGMRAWGGLVAPLHRTVMSNAQRLG